MIVIRTAFFSALVALVCTAPALAGPYSELIVFGDSLSDVGNVFQRTDDFPFVAAIPVSPPYFDGRFSNGPVYSEQLATALGLGPLTHSVAGGTNYAHGNAMTSGTSGFPSLVIDDIDDQVDDFLSSGTVDSDSLFVVFAGANDLLAEDPNVNTSVGNLITDIGRLITAGAENLLVANLPLLGLTPRFNDSGQSASMSALTESFNSALFTALDTLEASTPGVDFFRLDVAQLINDAIANPGAFGFVNVTEPAAPGLDVDTSGYDPNLIVDEPDTYLFWDELHPTTAAHALLAESALDAVTFSADFDFNGQVDEIDLATWEVSYGVNALADADGDGDSDGLDFLEWQKQRGNGVTTIGAVGTVVPEPNSLMISIGLLVWGYGRRQKLRP